MRTHIPCALIVGALVLTAGCSREPEGVSSNQEAAPQQTAQTAPAVDNLQVSPAPDATGTAAAAVTAGKPFYVTMNVENVDGGTPVTVHWYGPQGQPIAYETLTTDASNQQLSFTVDNTRDWQSGEYRAEVWIGARKVGEHTVEISGRDALSASVDDGA